MADPSGFRTQQPPADRRRGRFRRDADMAASAPHDGRAVGRRLHGDAAHQPRGRWWSMCATRANTAPATSSARRTGRSIASTSAAARPLLEKGARIEKVRVDLEPARRAEMVQKSGRRTVPQIWIGERHVGGCDDLYSLEREGKLDPLLEGSP